MCDRGRIFVAGENFVDRRAKPDHAAAQVELRNFERRHGIVGSSGRRRAPRNSDLGRIMGSRGLYGATM